MAAKRVVHKTPINHSLPRRNLSEILMPAMVVLLVVVAFMVGTLWQKVAELEKNGVSVKAAPGADPQAPAGPTIPVKAETLGLDPVTDKDHMKGSTTARLTWVEYSDLECPYCKQIHPSLQSLLTDYDGKIRWVYRHFPLESIHTKAPKESEAAECAAELGGETAFWKFIDRIYEVTPSNNGLDPAQLPVIAAFVGVNKTAFNTCLSSGKYTARVQANYDSGVKAGVSGTPANFLLDDKGNAWVISGAMPLTTLKQVVEAALKI